LAPKLRYCWQHGAAPFAQVVRRLSSAVAPPPPLPPPRHTPPTPNPTPTPAITAIFRVGGRRFATYNRGGIGLFGGLVQRYRHGTFSVARDYGRKARIARSLSCSRQTGAGSWGPICFGMPELRMWLRKMARRASGARPEHQLPQKGAIHCDAHESIIALMRGPPANRETHWSGVATTGHWSSRPSHYRSHACTLAHRGSRSAPATVRAYLLRTVASARENTLISVSRVPPATTRGQGRVGDANMSFRKGTCAKRHRVSGGDEVLVAVIDPMIDTKPSDRAGVCADEYDAIGNGAPPTCWPPAWGCNPLARELLGVARR